MRLRDEMWDVNELRVKWVQLLKPQLRAVMAMMANFRADFFKRNRVGGPIQVASTTGGALGKVFGAGCRRD